MPHGWSLLVLALAVSLDGFGVGAMYGLRKIRIPVISISIIAFMSGAVIYLSMQIGAGIAVFLSPSWAKMLGAIILIGIGTWAVYQMAVQKDEEEEEGRGPISLKDETAGKGKQTVLSIELKRLGLVIQILRTPSVADVDRSGIISASEAALLGLALSLDAFGAGIGAAFVGFAPILTSAVIAAASGLFIYSGLRIGFHYADMKWIRRMSVLPGIILILIGFLRLI